MTSLRLLRVYFLIFTVALVSLLAFIGWISLGEITRETDSVLNWQLRYLRRLPQDELAETIRRRTAYGHLHIRYYGLFDRDGKRVAGDILHLPQQLPDSSDGETLEHTLKVDGIARSPVVRIVTGRFDDGHTLLVGIDMTSLLTLRRTVVTMLIAGGVLGLVLSAGVGIVVGIRQAKRIEALRETATRVAAGDLGHRFKASGRDELAMLINLVNHMLDEVERLMSEVKGACDGIAHDLRAPLARVHGLMNHAMERADSLGQSHLLEMLVQARRETELVLDRFGAMVRVAQIAGLRRHGELDVIDLRALLFELGELYAPFAESLGMELTMGGHEQALVSADRALLFEMLGNLTSHLLDRLPQGARIVLELTMTQRGPRLAIAADGCEPEQSRSPHESEPDAQSDATTQDSADTNLGVAWAVASMHGFGLHIDPAAARVTIDCWPQTSRF
jgi:HAMP domain-containing protein